MLTFRVSLLLTSVLLLLGGCTTVPLQVESAKPLAPGAFEWRPERATSGPMLMVVSIDDQLAYVYRNGKQIGRTTVSTARPGKTTPTGVFTILEKKEDHTSTIYNSSMPYMQRLTWNGIAIHAGDLPGHPASAGCVRLPLEFSKLLYSATNTGTTVVITSRQAPVTQSARPASALLASGLQVSPTAVAAGDFWNPSLSGSGPVAIVLSVLDQTVLVFRNGVMIGKSAVTILPGPDHGGQSAVFMMLDGQLNRSSKIAPGLKERPWAVLSLDGAAAVSDPVGEVRDRLRVPKEFARKVYPILEPGTLFIMTRKSSAPETRSAPNFTIMTPQA
jgi:hypothetical protein